VLAARLAPDASQSVQPAPAVETEKAVKMAAREPLLSSGLCDRQLARGDVENSNTGTGHARDCQPTPGQARTGDRRCGTRSARASATNAGLDETYVPTHERPITWDISREPRHLRPHCCFPYLRTCSRVCAATVFRLRRMRTCVPKSPGGKTLRSLPSPLSQGSESTATRAVSKTVNPGSNPGSPA
jgi:hypothetical protein